MYEKSTNICDHCNEIAVISVKNEERELSAKLCFEHTPIPVAGDTLDTLYDRYFASLTVCSASLCGRWGWSWIGNTPFCKEHWYDAMNWLDKHNDEEN